MKYNLNDKVFFNIKENIDYNQDSKKICLGVIRKIELSLENPIKYTLKEIEPNNKETHVRFEEDIFPIENPVVLDKVNEILSEIKPTESESLLKYKRIPYHLNYPKYPRY